MSFEQQPRWRNKFIFLIKHNIPHPHAVSFLATTEQMRPVIVKYLINLSIKTN